MFSFKTIYMYKFRLNCKNIGASTKASGRNVMMRTVLSEFAKKKKEICNKKQWTVYFDSSTRAHDIVFLIIESAKSLQKAEHQMEKKKRKKRMNSYLVSTNEPRFEH